MTGQRTGQPFDQADLVFELDEVDEVDDELGLASELLDVEESELPLSELELLPEPEPLSEPALLSDLELLSELGAGDDDVPAGDVL